jgi:lysophospholipase L1-like esterase
MKATVGASTTIPATAITEDTSNNFATANELAILNGTAPAIISTGLLAEYRFNEGSGTVLTDYSGNGNTGAYVGSPTFLAAGGFTAASGKYATGTTGAFATMQTFYVAFELTTAATTFQAVIGNSIGATNLELLTTGVGNATRIGVLYAGTGAYGITAFPKPVVIVAVTISTTAAMWFNGVATEFELNADLTTKRNGAIWFGNSATAGHRLDGNILYFASYSAIHTESQILKNTKAIEDYLLKRGNKLTAKSFYETTSTPILLGVGDSITVGIGSTGNNTGWITRLSLNETFTIINHGYSSQYAARMAIMSVNNGNLFKGRGLNICTVMAGTNDLFAGSSTPSDTFLYITSICNRYKEVGYKVIVVTQCARSTNTLIRDLNSLIRANWRDIADDIADPASDPRIGDDLANTNTTYFNVDATHPNNTGHTIIAGYVSAAINRVISANSANPTLFVQEGTVTVANTVTETSILGVSGKTGSRWSNAEFVGTTVNTSTGVTAVGRTGRFVIGQKITGTNIQAGTTISAIPSSSTLTLSLAATGAGTSLLKTRLIGIKACYWVVGKSVTIRQKGMLSTTGTPKLNKKIIIGSTTVGSTGAVAMPNTITNQQYSLDVEITCLVAGDAATFWVEGMLQVGANYYPITNTATVSFDATIDNILNITDTWGAADPLNIDLSTNLVIKENY